MTSPAVNAVAEIINVVVVDIAFVPINVDSSVAQQLGALVQAVPNVTVQLVPDVAPTVILPAVSVPVILAALVPHELADVFATVGAVPPPIKCRNRKSLQFAAVAQEAPEPTSS